MANIYRNASLIAARMCGESMAMDAAAHRVEARVKAAAAPHTDEGDFMASIHVESVAGRKGVTDRAVSSDDPGALAIEFGHWQGNTWVPGIHAFTRAVAGS